MHAKTLEQIQAIKENRIKSISIMPTEYFKDLLRQANLGVNIGETKEFTDKLIMKELE
jgi:hypothetical protein